MLQLIATDHACQRARERLRWHHRTLARMLDRVFYDGLGPDECPARLAARIAALTQTTAGLTRIYGEHLFFFKRNLPDEVVLLTVYPLPSDLKPDARRARRQQHALAA